MEFCDQMNLDAIIEPDKKLKEPETTMSQVAVGKKVPDFSLPSTGDKTVRLKELRGKNVVIYFYPKDSTPGCTTEGTRLQAPITVNLPAPAHRIFGISRDSIKSHENFKAKQEFPFDLLSDAEEKACKLFDVIKEKNMYGRKVLGIERSTFLIDAEGRPAPGVAQGTCKGSRRRSSRSREGSLKS